MIRVTIRKPKRSRDWNEVAFGRLAGQHASREAAIQAVLAKLRKHRRRTLEAGEIVVRETDGSITTISV